MLRALAKYVLYSLLLWAACLSSASAESTLEQLLDGLKITRVSEFRYTETREMKLLNRPGLARGKLYVSPHRMVIEQTTPKQSVILIAANRLQYQEPARGIYFVKKLNNLLAAPGIGSFLGLLQAKMPLDQLQTQFLIEVEQQGGAWKIILIPRKQVDISRMEISGLVGRSADLLKLDYADGDVTTWALSLVAEGAAAREGLDAQLKLAEALTRPESSAER